MTEIVQFVSHAKAAAQENLNDFVNLAQRKLTAFSGGGAWDEVTWRSDRVSVVFCKYRPRSESRRPPVPLAEPFQTFAKAYFRYQYSHRPTTSAATMIKALRMIELALIQANGRAEIHDLSVPVLDLSARYCAELQKSKEAQYHVGHHIEAIADFCRRHYLVPVLPSWKSRFNKPAILTETLTEEGARHREAKLPTNHQMLALAGLFAQANDVESQYFTSIMALMMVAPSRISEVLALPVGCIGWEEGSKGEKQMYLRWHAAKGGGPMKKWVPASMQTVVEEAVARLTKIGARAREAARFAHDNPGQFMRHPLCTTPGDFGEDDELAKPQVKAALGLKLTTQSTWTTLPKTWAKSAPEGPVTYRMLADVTAIFFKEAHWPYINENKEVLVWEALCLVREFEYHKTLSLRPFSWRLPKSGEVNDRLGRRAAFSLFERAGISNPDDSPIKLTTHQLRHWLSTMSARAGMDDYTLARWAGRARIEDNRHYDHRTQEERSDELRSVLHEDQPTTLEKLKRKLPVTYSELGVDRPGTAKATLYGMCTHDYAMVPCMKEMECMTCKEHVCIKGKHKSLERIKRLEEQTAHLLNKAREASSNGEFGADRWVDNHTWKLSHVRTMRTLLEAESVPNGAVLRIPDEYDPSPVRRTLMDLNLIEVPPLTDTSVVRVIPLLEAPDRA